MAGELAVIVDEMRQLRAQFEALPGAIARAIIAADQRRVPHGPKREQLVVLRSAIHTAVGDRVFVVRELLEHAALPEFLALRVAIEDVVGDLDAGRALGRALSKAAALPPGDVQVVRHGVDRDGVLWSVRAG